MLLFRTKQPSICERLASLDSDRNRRWVAVWLIDENGRVSSQQSTPLPRNVPTVLFTMVLSGQQRSYSGAGTC